MLGGAVEKLKWNGRGCGGTLAYLRRKVCFFLLVFEQFAAEL